jgi:hypothetical protein
MKLLVMLRDSFTLFLWSNNRVSCETVQTVFCYSGGCYVSVETQQRSLFVLQRRGIVPTGLFNSANKEVQ